MKVRIVLCFAIAAIVGSTLASSTTAFAAEQRRISNSPGVESVGCPQQVRSEANISVDPSARRQHGFRLIRGTEVDLFAQITKPKLAPNGPCCEGAYEFCTNPAIGMCGAACWETENGCSWYCLRCQ